MIIKEKTCHGRNSDEDAVSIVSLCSCLLGQGDGSVGGDDVNPDYLISIPGNQDMYGRRREPHFFLKLSSDLHVHALVHM